MQTAPRAFQTFAIIPAAGRSQRMGRPKLLLPWQGTTVIEHVVAAWAASSVQQVIVVVAPDNVPLAEVCRGLPCHLLVPARPPPDMKASVCCALNWIEEHQSPQPKDAWLVAPADLPCLSAKAIDAVLTAYDPFSPTIVVPQHAGCRGHPVLFPWQFAPDAFALTEEQSLKDLLSRFPVREIETPAPLDDLDTPQDYSRLQGRHNP
jgi:molybdenum cofactor cytidylyltransferase